MKGLFIAAAGLAILAVSALAQVPEPGKAAAGASGSPTDLQKKIAYGIGVSFGKQLKAQPLELDVEAMVQGLRDEIAGKANMSDQQLREVMTSFQQEVIKKMKQAGEDFLAANKKKPGVMTTPSGLQYQVLKQGNGKTPKDSDTVVMSYEGKLTNGTVFDASAKHGGPQPFQVNGVIPGWTEALKLMKEGSKWRVFIPTNLAYNDRPPGPPIKPFDVLIFDMELVQVK